MQDYLRLGLSALLSMSLIGDDAAIVKSLGMALCEKADLRFLSGKGKIVTLTDIAVGVQLGCSCPPGGNRDAPQVAVY